MKQLSDCKDELHSCSKCGLCQSVCPIYKVTGNDCTVSRGHFIMLRGLIKGELKMSKTINRYLDLCLKCNACSDFCPSGIDVVDIVALAKAEYFKLHKEEKLKTVFMKLIIKCLNTVKNRKIFTPKSKTFEKKVLYFDGCEGIDKGITASVIKILNSAKTEVIIPAFGCCGMPFFARGDMDNFKECAENFYKILENYDNCDIVTNCATCESTIKSYAKWFNKPELNVKNVFDYIKENNLPLELKKHKKVTFHKPCRLDNEEQVMWILNNTKNLEYTEMKDFDECCGLNGITKLSEYKTLSKIFRKKRENIINTEAKTVLTSCFGCRTALRLFSFGKYKVEDCIKFLAKNMK